MRRLNEPSHLDLCCFTFSLLALHKRLSKHRFVKIKKKVDKCRLKFGTKRVKKCLSWSYVYILQELEKAKEQEGVPDDEGWVTVTRHGKNKATPFTEAHKRHITQKEKKRRKEKV